jgi:hypothetical protein
MNLVQETAPCTSFAYRMAVIYEQNEYGLKHPDEKAIVGWTLGDKPDNAQPLCPGRPSDGCRARPASLHFSECQSRIARVGANESEVEVGRV